MKNLPPVGGSIIPKAYGSVSVQTKKKIFPPIGKCGEVPEGIEILCDPIVKKHIQEQLEDAMKNGEIFEEIQKKK